MTYKFLLSVFLTSLGFSAFLPSAAAQERPRCYIIDGSGELTDLTDICDVSEKRSPAPAPTTNDGVTIINNNHNIGQPYSNDVISGENRYILGDDDFSFDFGIDSSYYIDNALGMDYTAYLRQYRVSPTSLTREALRDRVFQFDDYPKSLTSLLREGRNEIPFIIYQYQI
jgi:hypothetical protein